MVLLTQSSLSVIISTIVVCLFTFLLFLSGYVLQQQTVRSLQEALQAPIEVRIRPQIVIPTQLQDNTTPDSSHNEIILDERFLNNAGQQTTVEQQVILVDGSAASSESEVSKKTRSITEIWYDYVDSLNARSTNESQALRSVPRSRQPFNPDVLRQDISLAYILPVARPENLCSALLFAKRYRIDSQLTGTRAQPSIILLYPMHWDHSAHPEHKTALELLVLSEHEHATLLHPAPISKVWNGISVESQLLAELARNVWSYDRALYLHMPGIAIDFDRLDELMLRTLTRATMESEWSKLKSHSRAALDRVEKPAILLHAKGKGLMTLRNNKHPPVVPLRSNPGLMDRDAAFLVVQDEEGAARESYDPELKFLYERWQDEQNSVCATMVH